MGRPGVRLGNFLFSLEYDGLGIMTRSFGALAKRAQA